MLTLPNIIKTAKMRLKLVDCKWRFNAANFIRSKKFIVQTLKLVTMVAKCQDLLDFKSSLFFANTQVVRQIILDVTFFL